MQSNPLQTLTEVEVAGVLKVTVAAVRKWRRQGIGPRHVRIGRLVRYRASAVKEWLDSHTPEAGAVAPAIAANPVIPSSQAEAAAPIKPNGSDRTATTFDDL
jgi:predicted DNA-binding transcriptional regulator AlpA